MASSPAHGEIDWIPNEPEIDFAALFAQFDTLLMGRRTYRELPGGAASIEDQRIIVFSRTLKQEEHPDVTVMPELITAWIDELRAEPGKDIWLFGGGELFRTLLDLGRVDTVEPAVVPVLLGGGWPSCQLRRSRERLRSGATAFTRTAGSCCSSTTWRGEKAPTMRPEQRGSADPQNLKTILRQPMN